MLDIAFVLIVITALLVVVGLCQPLAAYLKLPPPVLLGVVGLALGGFPALVTHLGWSRGTDAFSEVFVDLPVSSGIFIYVFLPLLVFEAGIATDVRRMLEDAAPILLLAIVATLISTAVVGLALWPFGRVSLVVCLLLGSVVSTTDPAAVIAIFRDIGAPARLTRLVEGEALLNDAAAIALFAVLLGMIGTARELDIGSGLKEFFMSFVGGDFDSGARLRSFYRRRAPASCIGRRRRTGLRHDHQRARPFSHRALQLVVPDRPLGPTRLLGPLVDFYPRLDPCSKAARR
jgi:CPA1 family monovalent cation:H+ antiporter